MTVLNYEIHEQHDDSSNIFDKQEIDILLNNDNFFYENTDNNNYLETDHIISQQIDYSQNYNIKKLTHIAKYYNLNIKKNKKEEIIDNIIQFENNPENSIIVYNRKRLWYYLNELKNDNYFSKFIIF
tara:strand:+ start:318 stop:698 length:381 start_codon:yes stop_codon:yes gene_type:complete